MKNFFSEILGINKKSSNFQIFLFKVLITSITLNILNIFKKIFF